MKRLLVLSLIITLFNATANASAIDNCRTFADSTIGKVMTVFHDTATSEEKKRDKLADIFTTAVDTAWIGKFVLGQYWRNASEQEKQQFLLTYRDYLTNVYVSKFKDESGLNVDDIAIASFTEASQGAGKYLAKTLVKSKGEADVHVDYIIDQAEGQCKVHDISIEGVSLLASQRSEFKALAARSGVQGVIESMQNKNSLMTEKK